MQTKKEVGQGSTFCYMFIERVSSLHKQRFCLFHKILKSNIFLISQ